MSAPVVMATCWACRYFAHDEGMEADEGYCRRFPPVVVATDDGDVAVVWPPVGTLEWCGEFEEDGR